MYRRKALSLLLFLSFLPLQKLRKEALAPSGPQVRIQPHFWKSNAVFRITVDQNSTDPSMPCHNAAKHQRKNNHTTYFFKQAVETVKKPVTLRKK